MLAYYRSVLAGDLFLDLDRAIESLQDGQTGLALGLLCCLRDGPYPLRRVTLSDPPFAGEPLDPNSAEDWELLYGYKEPRCTGA